MATKKTTKKTVKKAVEKTPIVITEPKIETISVASKDSCNCGPKCFCGLDKKKKTAWIVLIVLVILTGLYFLKGFFIVALVNGKPVSRFSVDRELEKQAGKSILNNKIAEMLVLDEAAKQKIAVTQSEIDQKIKEIESQIVAQGQTLDALLTAQGLSKAEFTKQVKIQILVEKILGKDIVVEDQEISDYFTQNKATMAVDATLESQKENIKQTLFENKLSEKIQTWLQELQAKAKIINFVQF